MAAFWPKIQYDEPHVSDSLQCYIEEINLSQFCLSYKELFRRVNMETQVVRRRVNMIAGHFAGTEELSATQLLPLNCNNNISSVAPRYDNRMLFARQGSNSQACFMRQVSNIREGDSPQNDYVNKHSTGNPAGAPLFSRQAQTKHEPSTVEYRPVRQECQLSIEEPPMFSRPYRVSIGQVNSFSKCTRPDGMKASPRMDVKDSGRYYTMTVKLPGIGIDNIRVEVDDQNLIVMGKRSTPCWRASTSLRGSPLTHRRGNSVQGPYQVVWPLPSDVNKDHISAEIVNGVLRITIPKY